MNRDNGLDILTLWLSFLPAAHSTHLSTHCHLEHPEALYLSPLFTTSMYVCTNDPANRPVSLFCSSFLFFLRLCPFRCSSHPPSQHVKVTSPSSSLVSHIPDEAVWRNVGYYLVLTTTNDYLILRRQPKFYWDSLVLYTFKGNSESAYSALRKSIDCEAFKGFARRAVA